jgi:hypothetical protein
MPYADLMQAIGKSFLEALISPEGNRTIGEDPKTAAGDLGTWHMGAASKASVHRTLNLLCCK